MVKLNSDLSVAWSQDYGLNTGADQIFDLVVDRYLITDFLNKPVAYKRMTV